ncbi:MULTISPECIES: DnaJ family domain-containing protein [unclassified Modestobacter]
MTERKPEGMSFDTWVERQIDRARADGAFDDLGPAGKPLPRRDREETAYDWALAWARREDGDAGTLVAGMLPTGFALRKEREQLPALVARQTSEAAVRAVVEAHNARVDQYYRRPVEGVWVPVGMADVDAELAQWRRNGPVAPAPTAGPASSAPTSPRRRRWFRRRPG